MDLDTKQVAQIANFVQFAYNMFAAGGLTPPLDPGIAAAGFDLSFYLTASDFDDRRFYGYIAASSANPGDVVMAIRGTEDPAEWLLDFLALPVPFTPAPDAGFVALGFLSLFNSFELVDKTGNSMTLSAAAAQMATATPFQSFLVVGHSLGAALATLAAAELAINNLGGVREVLTVYTFASPRVGLLDFAASFSDAVKTSFRIWNTLDSVPEVPTFPYIHVSGLGDAIVQTEQQLSTLAFTPACEHHLTSYQWLLDPASFPLGVLCAQSTHPALRAALKIPVELETNTSGRVLRKAARGWL
jgi:triacylglycerol lipase